MKDMLVMEEHAFSRRERNRSDQSTLHDLVFEELMEAVAKLSSGGRVVLGDTEIVPVKPNLAILLLDDWFGLAFCSALIEDNHRTF